MIIITVVALMYLSYPTVICKRMIGPFMDPIARERPGKPSFTLNKAEIKAPVYNWSTNWYHGMLVDHFDYRNAKNFSLR